MASHNLNAYLILDKLKESPRGLTVIETAAVADMSRPGAYRILALMVTHGMVAVEQPAGAKCGKDHYRYRLTDVQFIDQKMAGIFGRNPKTEGRKVMVLPQSSQATDYTPPQRACSVWHYAQLAGA